MACPMTVHERLSCDWRREIREFGWLTIAADRINGSQCCDTRSAGFDHHTHGRSYELCAGLCSSMRASASGNGADNVGGPWIARGKGRVGKAIAAAFNPRFACGGARGHDPNYSGPVDTVYLGCWHREIFDRIGFFDEELVRNQDDEFNLRIVRSGGKVWQSVKIKSCYYPRESLRHLFAQYMQYGYWKARILQKHRLPASFRHLIPRAFVSHLLLLPVSVSALADTFWVWVSLVGLYVAINVFSVCH